MRPQRNAPRCAVAGKNYGPPSGHPTESRNGVLSWYAGSQRDRRGVDSLDCSIEKGAEPRWRRAILQARYDKSEIIRFPISAPRYVHRSQCHSLPSSHIPRECTERSLFGHVTRADATAKMGQPPKATDRYDIDLNPSSAGRDEVLGYRLTACLAESPWGQLLIDDDDGARFAVLLTRNPSVPDPTA